MTATGERDRDLEWALRLHKAGVHAEAAEAYRAILAKNPDHPEACFLLASIELDAGAAAAAAVGFARAAIGSAAPDEALAGLFEALGALDTEARGKAVAAIRAFEALPRAPDTVARLGRVLMLAGEPNGALALVDYGLAAHPDHRGLLRLRAGLLAALGMRTKSVAAFAAAAAVDPDNVEILIAQAAALVGAGRAGEAIAIAERAVEVSLGGPGSEWRRTALLQLADCHRECGGGAAAIDACRHLAARHPGLPEPWIALARSLRAAGRHDAAEAAAADGLTRAGDDLELRWLHCFYALAPICASMAEMVGRRAAYAARLDGLASRLATVGTGERARAELLVGDPTPFLLPYQYGEDDRALQAEFGAMARQILAPRDRPAAVPARPDGRIRVVFVSAFIWRHTNWRMKRGWVRYLDRSRFHVSCLHLGARVDDMTREVQGWSDRFDHLPDDFEGAIRLLRKTAPDVIFYPEVGMSGIVQRLAALRLAPVQYCAWGHPVTTGLPTIDYFVSSALMEPDDGERHYTETLLRLPGLSFPYIPAPLAAPALGREDFGLPAAACLFLCLQTPQKYLPADDDLYPRIAERAPEALFVFLAGGGTQFDMPILERRLADAFAARGLDPARHVRFLPHLDPARYQALNAIGDVYLDTPGWSGGNTTLEALQQDLPVVTLPGKLMRARHSAAMLRLIGVEETIAGDRDDYVRIAAGLAADPDRRREISARIRARKSILATDMRSIAALEDHLVGAVGRSRPAR